MSTASDLRRAEGLRRSGKLEKAVELVRTVLEREPESPEGRHKLAEILVEAGNKDGAISEYVKLQELLTADGDLLGAIACGLKVVELDPKFDNPLAYVAKVKVENLREEQRRKGTETVPVRPVTPLDKIPLLSELTSEELGSVAGSMRRQEVPEGDVVFSEGDEGTSLYFVNRGVLEVKAEGSKLGLVKGGQCFGEFSFLTGQPRTASVRAIEASELLELSSAGMRKAVENHPRLRDVLFSMYRERALVNVLSLSPLFQVLPTKDRVRLAPRFKLVTLKRGDAVFQEGDAGSALYLIKDGAMEVRATIDGDSMRLATLGKHQFFGEVSFLTGVPRTATVHALEDSELMKIEEDELQELIRHHPFMKDVLSRYHLDRVTATAETLKAFMKRDRVEGIVS